MAKKVETKLEGLDVAEAVAKLFNEVEEMSLREKQLVEMVQSMAAREGHLLSVVEQLAEKIEKYERAAPEYGHYKGIDP